MDYKITIENLVLDRKKLLESITGFIHKGMLFNLTEHDVEEIVLRLSSYAKDLKASDLQDYILGINVTLIDYLSKLSKETNKKTVTPIAYNRELLGLINPEGKLDLISTTYLHPEKDAIVFSIKTNNPKYSDQIRELIKTRKSITPA